MKRNGPLITLLAGLAVAAVLIMLSVTAATKDEQSRNAGNNSAQEQAGNVPGATPGDGQPGSPTAGAGAPTAAAPAPLKGPVTWAGDVQGSGGLFAIAGKDGKVIAYFCDGKNEAWLQGTAVGGKLELTGKNASASGKFANGIASGSLTIKGKSWTFELPTVKPPSGLYRVTANVRNAKIVGGWIEYKGQQVGAYTSDGGESVTAPPLNTDNNTATIDGQQVTAAAVVGDAIL